MTQPDTPSRRKREVTRLLRAWSGGDEAAAGRLTELVYGQVRAIAGKHLRQFGGGPLTLQATELANELFLRLLDAGIDWQDRRHFYGLVGVAMRRILVDTARAAPSGAAAAKCTSRCRPPRTSAATRARRSAWAITARNNLAQAIQLQGRIVEATALLQENVDRMRAAHAEHTPSYAIGLNNLASLREQAGDDGGARWPCSRKCCATRRPRRARTRACRPIARTSAAA